MSDQLQLAMNLQLIENRRQSLIAALEQIPKRLSGATALVVASKQEIADAATQIEDGKKERRGLEGEIEATKSRIRKYRGQLLEVKTNKEYAALTQEIKEAEAEIVATEDRILVSMEGEEGLLLDKEKAGRKLQEAEGALAIEQEKATAEEGRMKEDLAELDRERESLRSAMDAPLLAHFDKVFRGRGGLAVARTEAGACSGCLVRVRPQVLSEVRDGQVRYCDSCKRILFIDRSEERATG